MKRRLNGPQGLNLIERNLSTKTRVGLKVRRVKS
nr:MAG TPA: hypothetical protein [Caudoviricetes sp.]